MKTLVTGGAGFIGSHVVAQLLTRGDEVVVVDDFSTGTEENLRAAEGESGRSVRTHRVDITSADAADAVLRERPDVVLLLAAQSSVKVSMRAPVRDAQVNVIGMLQVLDAAVTVGCRKVVFASSGGTIYGAVEETRLPLREDLPTAPVSFYGVSKAVFGQYLEVYRQQRGMEYVALALGNVYGPRQTPHGEAGVVAIFAGRMLAGRPCVINGDGLTTRDYVHVDDVARAFVLATRHGRGLINIGTGQETSVAEIHQRLQSVLAQTAEPVSGPALPGEVRRVVLDATVANRELGWRPELDLDRGLRSVTDWMRALPPGHSASPWSDPVVAGAR